LATLAAGAAHELATPLSTIFLVSRELERTATSDRTGADLRLIADEVLRCQDVLGQLSADAGEGLGERATPQRVRALLVEAASPLRDTRIQVDACDEEVRVPARLIGQVIRRLLGNALSASRPEQNVWLRASLLPHQLTIRVEDAGLGMSPAVLERAGEPFFTTRPQGEGRGLGLYFCRSVVERLGGTFGIVSEPSRGTTVTLTLPHEAP
jgi:two-component system sensor histidine kinase RegB